MAKPVRPYIEVRKVDGDLHLCMRGRGNSKNAPRSGVHICNGRDQAAIEAAMQAILDESDLYRLVTGRIKGEQ